MPTEIEGVTVRTASSVQAAKPDGSQLDAQFALYRRFVPLAEEVTYLNASFAPPSNLIVHEAITRYSHEALHSPTPKPGWQEAAQDVRELLARYINADPTSLAITRDTTEGLNSFIQGLELKAGDNVVVLDSEHPNHVYGWMALRAKGVEVRQVPTMVEARATGCVVAATAATFAPCVDANTRAIGISSVMFHSGQWNDVGDICATYRPKGIHVLVDCTQQVGFADIDVRAWSCSAAAFSCHKGLNAPTGFAALYVDPDVIGNIGPIPPIVGYGAVSNVREDLLVPADDLVFHPSARRYEHLNMSLIAAAAAKAFLGFYLDTMGPENVKEHLYRLGDALRAECRALGIPVVGPEDRQSHAPHLYILDLQDPKWSELLRETNIYVTTYRLGIRVSFGFYNNTADVKRLAEVLAGGVTAGIPITSWSK
ncbi:PLP-dependent transferase [Thozetella sp. PMI_491]|nr:PLP-dependent transferase [Thozetella sp. PMI_491]